MPLQRLTEGSEPLEARLDALVAAHRAGQYPFGCAIANLATELVSDNEELGTAIRAL